MLRNLLKSKIGSEAYIICSLFVSIIFFFAGLGAVEVVDSSFLSFLLSWTMGYKFFWDAIVEYNHYLDTYHKEN